MPARQLHEIPEHSILAEPVLDGEGRILLRAGTVLTRAVIGVLTRLHVSQVAVEEPRSSPSPSVAPDRVLTEPAGQQFPRTSGWEPLFAEHRGSEEMRIIEAGLNGWAAARSAQHEARAEANA